MSASEQAPACYTRAVMTWGERDTWHEWEWMPVGWVREDRDAATA